jgi:hypothetical protein
LGPGGGGGAADWALEYAAALAPPTSGNLKAAKIGYFFLTNTCIRNGPDFDSLNKNVAFFAFSGHEKCCFLSCTREKYTI